VPVTCVVDSHPLQTKRLVCGAGIVLVLLIVCGVASASMCGVAGAPMCGVASAASVSACTPCARCITPIIYYTHHLLHPSSLSLLPCA